VERQVQAMERASRLRRAGETNRRQLLRKLIEEFGKERAISASAGFIAVPLEAAYLEAMTVRPDLIHRYLDIQLEGNLQDIEVLAAMGVDIIWGGGDFCSNHGPAYSPEHFRTFILPRLARITECGHRFGLPYFFRTDGWTWPVAQYLFVESGVDGYGEIDAQAGMDLGELKAKLFHLLLWGNVDCARTLSSGSREDVVAETKACIERAAPGGGYILGSSNSIHSGVPADNFLAMIDTVREFGRY
jgi:uroporphyrinogen decarboxylase